MPELPEVETTRLGLLPYVVGRKIVVVTVRDFRLRWPIPSDIATTIEGQTIRHISRRGKYLVFELDGGFLLSHLGMSGTLRAYLKADVPIVAKHDHVDIVLSDATVLRYTDPRRFGALLWIAGAHLNHPLLDSLGPEPLSDAGFSGNYLFEKSRNKTQSIKQFIMDGHVVVGVGNIYASESLFRAGIHPARQAGRISRPRYILLATVICETLRDALAVGGSSLRDYVSADGDNGYFQINAFVYGREGALCRVCAGPVLQIRQGQRATFFCKSCQK
jgi:formamidopyrimidine-DNA glycosylase